MRRAKLHKWTVNHISLWTTVQQHRVGAISRTNEAAKKRHLLDIAICSNVHGVSKNRTPVLTFRRGCLADHIAYSCHCVRCQKRPIRFDVAVG